MTAKSPTPAEARAMAVSCPTCYVRAGQWCTRPNGADPEHAVLASKLHGGRWPYG